MLSDASLATKAAYQLRWYRENRERVLATRRAKYAADTDWQAKRIARRNSIRMANAKKKAEYRALVDMVKANPCVDCGMSFPPECMDFDHVRGKKIFQIGQMGQRQKHLILAEIAKCELVCANCHRMRTRMRKQQGKGRPISNGR